MFFCALACLRLVRTRLCTNLYEIFFASQLVSYELKSNFNKYPKLNLGDIPLFVTSNNLENNKKGIFYIQYQPRGDGALTHSLQHCTACNTSPPASMRSQKSKMADWGPQNG